MTPVESLPPDQRAVLELVLRRGRTYDEIAQLLSIDRAGVRQRALSALDALGPDAGVPAERRALITDYLLGALPPRVAEQVRLRLADAPAERAWARVIAAELEPTASQPLPEIPAPADAMPRPAAAVQEPEPEQPTPPEEPEAAAATEPAPGRARTGRRRRERDAGAAPAAAAKGEAPSAAPGRGRLGPRAPLEPGRERPTSRRGGRVVLTAAVIIVLAVVLSVVFSSGGSKKPSGTSAKTGTTLTTAKTTATTPKTPAGSQILAQINLNPPSGGGKSKGIAEVLREGGKDGLAVVATGLTPNTSHDAYAVWLSNSPTDSHLLGFVSPAVGSNGRLQTAGALPSNAGHFKKLLVTRETKASPTSPGTIVLEGTLSGVS
jgi:hypothetical protein